MVISQYEVFWTENYTITWYEIHKKELPPGAETRKDTLLHWAASSARVPSNMRNMRRVGSSCACATYHPGVYSPIHFVVTKDSVSGS